MTSDPELLTKREGALGIIILARPQATNALSLGMLRATAAALDRFAQDPTVGAVAMTAQGQTFSSGGDIVGILSHPPGPSFERFRRDYFFEEYRLNHQIHTYSKPYIALVDGLAMGGGCGVSLHGSHVVTTERTVMAMPETMIGHFTDAGGSWFLNRMPGEMGVYAGLRGLRLTGADATALGLANCYVPSKDLPSLLSALTTTPVLDRGAVDAILAKFRTGPPISAVLARLERVNALFGHDTVEAIASALESAKESWAQAALGVIRCASPRSLKVSLKMLREARALPIGEALQREYRICMRVTASSDFREGGRAALIDKDNAPRWQPDLLELLSNSDIEEYFAPLAPSEPELELAR
jgi:enoyl-CoA hydratase